MSNKAPPPAPPEDHKEEMTEEDRIIYEAITRYLYAYVVPPGLVSDGEDGGRLPVTMSLSKLHHTIFDCMVEVGDSLLAYNATDPKYNFKGDIQLPPEPTMH